MARRATNPKNALTAIAVRNLKAPGRHADGGGLYLHIRDNGSKNWVLRIKAHGKRRDIGLGVYPDISLTDAREASSDMRRTVAAGGNPIEERKLARTAKPTFAEAARLVFEARKATWKNPKHRAQWISTLETYAFPEIGDRRIDHIETADVLRVLSAIWLTKPETARRVRQRIGAVMDWAKAAGHRDGENPVAGVGRGLPKQSAKVKHHEAMPYGDLPAFMTRLPDLRTDEATKAALAFTILTAARTSEATGADWREIDLEAALWTVPAERMKADRDHRIPLSGAVVAVLERARAFSDGAGYVFPGRKHGKPLSNMAMLMAMRRANETATVHGFRSTFNDWASESTRFPREVVEASLAHAIENRVEAAYRRGDLLDKRRQLMAAWGDFATGARGSVVALAAATG